MGDGEWVCDLLNASKGDAKLHPLAFGTLSVTFLVGSLVQHVHAHLIDSVRHHLLYQECKLINAREGKIINFGDNSNLGSDLNNLAVSQHKPPFEGSIRVRVLN